MILINANDLPRVDNVDLFAGVDDFHEIGHRCFFFAEILDTRSTPNASRRSYRCRRGSNLGAIHEEASVKTGSETSAGFPNHPFGISRQGGAP